MDYYDSMHSLSICFLPPRWIIKSLNNGNSYGLVISIISSDILLKILPAARSREKGKLLFDDLNEHEEHILNTFYSEL